MFNLPETTKVERIIEKNIIYERFVKELSGAKKERFDRDIGRIIIKNEISEKSIKLPKTDKVSAIFVLQIELKTKDYLEYNLVLISKLFGQKLLLILKYGEEYRQAIFEARLIVSEWKMENEISLTLRGLNLQSVWENLVTQVGGFEIATGHTLEEQIEIEAKKNKLKKLIEITEQRAKRELQAKKKLELFKEIKKYKKELEEL